MEWFTEPVWLGNFIVARWAAILGLTLIIVGSAGLAVAIIGMTVRFLMAIAHWCFQRR